MQENPTVADLTLHAPGRHRVTLLGQQILLDDGKTGRIPCGTDTAARALFEMMLVRPAHPGEDFFAWLLRAVADYEAAVWVRLGRAR